MVAKTAATEFERCGPKVSKVLREVDLQGGAQHDHVSGGRELVWVRETRCVLEIGAGHPELARHASHPRCKGRLITFQVLGNRDGHVIGRMCDERLDRVLHSNGFAGLKAKLRWDLGSRMDRDGECAAVVAAAIRQAFLQPDRESASQTWRQIADQLRARWPKLGTLMDESETDVLAYMTFPAPHRTKLHSVNPLERLNKEVKRRADVVGIFPNEGSIVRLIGAVLLEQNDEWQLQARYMQVEAMTEMLTDSPAEITALPPKAA